MVWLPWLYFYLFISPIVLVLQIIVWEANLTLLSCIASVPCYSLIEYYFPSLTNFGFGLPNSIHTQTTWRSIHAIQVMEMLKCNKLTLWYLMNSQDYKTYSWTFLSQSEYMSTLIQIFLKDQELVFISHSFQRMFRICYCSIPQL